MSKPSQERRRYKKGQANSCGELKNTIILENELKNAVTFEE